MGTNKANTDHTINTLPLPQLVLATDNMINTETTRRNNLMGSLSLVFTKRRYKRLECNRLYLPPTPDTINRLLTRINL